MAPRNAPDRATDQSSSRPVSAEMARLHRNLNDTGSFRDMSVHSGALMPEAGLAGAPGFEPGNGGIKIRCLTTWLRPITATARRAGLGGAVLAASPAALNRLRSEVATTLRRDPWAHRRGRAPQWSPHAADRRNRPCARRPEEPSALGGRAAVPALRAPPPTALAETALRPPSMTVVRLRHGQAVTKENARAVQARGCRAGGGTAGRSARRVPRRWDIADCRREAPWPTRTS